MFTHVDGFQVAPSAPPHQAEAKIFINFKVVPKPPGSAGRGKSRGGKGKRGYNVQETFELSTDDYNYVRVSA